MAKKEKLRIKESTQSKHGRNEGNESTGLTKQTKQQMEGMKRMISTNPHNPPPVDSMTARENTSSSPFTVNVSLDEASYQQQMRDLDRQVQTRSVREKKEQLKAAWEKIKAEMDKTEHEAIVNETSVQAVDQHCRNSFGKVRVTNKMREEADKAGLQLKLTKPDLMTEIIFLNRDGGGLNQSKCMMSLKERMLKRYTLMMKTLVRNLTQQSQKEVLIELQLNTDSEAKEEKATLEERCKELTQKLESTEQSLVSQRTDTSIKQKTLQSELEEKKKLINELEDKVEQSKLKKSEEKGDGGGLEPVKVYDNVTEGKDAEEIQTDDEDTDQKSDTTVTEGVADRTPTEHRQSLEDIQTKLEMERATLESQLKEAKEEKATLEERCKELTQKLESSEQSLVSQRIENRVEREKLKSEVEEKKKLINELEDKVGEYEDKLEQSDLKKSGEKGDGGGLKPVKVFDDVIEGKEAEQIQIDDEDTDQISKKMLTGRVDSISHGKSLKDIQSKLMERATLESQLKEAKEEKAILEEGRKELTQKLESTEQSLVSQRIVNRVEREKLQSELQLEEKLAKELDYTVEELDHNLELSLQREPDKDLT
ncbi:myosin-6-like [Ptychodera flava]|uniref:myosin-6-like n=1 Tax=Ptychodera flava TaxID=63121 RepID=UPI00396A2752